MTKPSKAPMVEGLRVIETTYEAVTGEEMTDAELGQMFYVEKGFIVPAWRLRFDGVYPSQNVLMRTYANHHAYARLIKMWADRFWAAMIEGKIPKATTRRRLTITRFVREEKYKLDRGNLVGGGKPFLDAAVRVGLIRNDREEDVDDIYRQAIDKDEHIEVLVQDL